MTARIFFFPVGNGDMTLLKTETGHSILIDINIREPDDGIPDVAQKLRDILERDGNDRLYVDAFLLSHPEQDHCRGLTEYFHLGPPDEWSKTDDKILIREVWSSPIVFRRASKNFDLCEDAEAFTAEARRRVRAFREDPSKVNDGNRILILAEDEDGKTDDLNHIVIKVGDVFSVINGSVDRSMQARLLAPLPAEDDEDEEIFTMNNSSTILQISLTGGGVRDKCSFLTAGDAEVEIWEKLWEHHCNNCEYLSYDILQSPHHCSWHSLSHDSWSELRKKAEVSESARNALSQARSGATIVASSKPIVDDDDDPPCIGAKWEYEAIVEEVSGTFECVGEHPSEDNANVLEFEITADGVRKLVVLVSGGAASHISGDIGRKPFRHG